jgi:glycosyltransferase involved in cell wall biosynthesis
VSGDVRPDVSVIIPTRNRRHILPRAIASVLGQTHENLELIVIDDNSDDGTADYLATIADRRFRWFRFDEWRHGGAARNHGAAVSRAPILAFLDSDDRYLPDRLRSDVAFFADHPEADVRISSFESMTNSGSSLARNPEAILSRDEFERYLVGYCLHLGSSGIAMRRSLFEGIGGFDESMIRMQDRDLLLRVARVRGCASTSEINWVKTRSEDSLSHQPEGQVRAFGELCRRHPIIPERHPELLRYLVAREIVSPVLQGRFRQARAAFDEARAANPGVDMAPVGLISAYLAGKRHRRALKHEIYRRFGTRAE